MAEGESAPSAHSEADTGSISPTVATAIAASISPGEGPPAHKRARLDPEAETLPQSTASADTGSPSVSTAIAASILPGEVPPAQKKARLDPEAETVPESTMSADTGSPSVANAITASILPGEGPPAQKKARLDHPEAENVAQSTASSSHPLPDSPFLHLPLELLAEILIHTRSPADVLAVARCSKSLCHTLLSPSSTYIWRSARKSYVCPPPEPLEIYSEAAYAAFIFDAGKCVVCQKLTETPYASFALKLRFCRDLSCLSTFMKTMVVPKRNEDPDRVILQWTPVVESARPFNEYSNPWPNGPAYCPRNSWDLSVIEYTTSVHSETFLPSKSKDTKRNTRWMEWCVSLHEWKQQRNNAYRANKSINDTMLKHVADTNGWDIKDILDCTPYGPLHRHKNKVIESISLDEVRMLTPVMDASLLQIAEKRKRRLLDSVYIQNREDIETHYNRLRSQKSPPIFPSLSAFRELPIIITLQSSPGSGVSKTLQHGGVVKSLLEDQIEKWVDCARQEFGAMLGYPGWKSAKTKIIHPAERLTARYICKLCRKVATKYAEDECLDFRGACAHECPKPKNASKPRKRKPAWSANQFELDIKATSALTKLFSLLPVDVARSTNSLTPNKYVLCMSCEHPMVLQANSVLGHCHRHEEMEMQTLPDSQAEVLLGPYKYEKGLAMKMMTYDGYKKKEIMEEKIYGCRHCLRSGLSETAVLATQETAVGGSVIPEASLPAPQGTTGDASTSVVESDPAIGTSMADGKKDSVKEASNSKKLSRFNFNGLRSHLKSKHHIEKVRDEDLFSFNSRRV